VHEHGRHNEWRRTPLHEAAQLYHRRLRIHSELDICTHNNHSADNQVHNSRHVPACWHVAAKKSTHISPTQHLACVEEKTVLHTMARLMVKLTAATSSPHRGRPAPKQRYLLCRRSTDHRYPGPGSMLVWSTINRLDNTATQSSMTHDVCRDWHQKRVNSVCIVPVLPVRLCEQWRQHQHDGKGPHPADPSWCGCCQIGECCCNVALSQQRQAVQHEVRHVPPRDDAPAAPHNIRKQDAQQRAYCGLSLQRQCLD
jgi:hypothetical protein